MASIYDKKAFVSIQLAGYPHGIKIKCHVWTEQEWEKIDFSNFVKENFKLEGEEYEKYTLHDIFVHNVIYTNTRKNDEKYDVIIVDSVVRNKGVKKDDKKKDDKKKDDKKKDVKTNLKKVTLYNQTEDDIKEFIQSINDELFMREHGLSNDEFEFFKKNEEITINNVKELFIECEGDIYKLRKNKIRDNIQNILKEKKVV